MSTEHQLCKHVTLQINKTEKVATLLRGAIYPYFGWSRKQQADTPRLRCSECHKSIVILGYIVKRDPAALHVPRRESRDASATRKQTRKPNQSSSEGPLSFSFSD